MQYSQTLNTIFFYLFLPLVSMLALIVGRLYNSRKESKYKNNHLTQGLIIGNVITGIFSVFIIMFLYAYILNLSPLIAAPWEFLAHSAISLLLLIAGIGLGAHLAGVSLEKTLRDKLTSPEFKDLSHTVHHFHFNLGHKLPFGALILITYTLTLLDLFKGTPIIMTNIHIILSTFTGCTLGTLFAIIFIITYSTKSMLKVSSLTLVSIFLVAGNESINLIEHPVAYVFTCFYASIIFWIEAKYFLPRPLIKKLITLTKAGLKWDGIILHPDHQVFRRLKYKTYNEKSSSKSP